MNLLRYENNRKETPTCKLWGCGTLPGEGKILCPKHRKEVTDKIREELMRKGF